MDDNGDTAVQANTNFTTNGLQDETSLEPLAYQAVKRAFDIVFSGCSLAVLSPLLLAIAASIKMEDGGPVIYRRWCIGKDEKPFPMYKFRTMVLDAEDEIKKHLTPEQLEQWNMGFKVDDDPRVTKIGKKLRRTSLDELPQLINILKNEMSLIGPRPVTPPEYECYSSKDKKLLVSIKPGLTGYWQVMARGNVAYKGDEAKDLQLYYVKHASLGLDARIFFKTFSAVFKGSK